MHSPKSCKAFKQRSTPKKQAKNALVMPFIQSVLGYDVFDPHEVVPAFTCDAGTKKGENIDYAILKKEEVQILMACKTLGEH